MIFYILERDGPTNQQTDGLMDRASKRDALAHLKKEELMISDIKKEIQADSQRREEGLKPIRFDYEGGNSEV